MALRTSRDLVSDPPRPRCPMCGEPAVVTEAGRGENVDCDGCEPLFVEAGPLPAVLRGEELAAARAELATLRPYAPAGRRVLWW